MLVCPICGRDVELKVGEEEGYSGEWNGHPCTQWTQVEWYECPEHGEVEPVDEYEYWSEEVSDDR